jgi:pyruvate/2-oxoglutarate dehydrogenase complex dihydrolipoamide acyltransferase (E2) component
VATAPAEPGAEAEEAAVTPTIDPTAAFARASEAMSRAGRSTPAGAAAAAPSPSQAAAPSPTAPAAAASPLPAIGRLARESTLDDAAAALAGDLRSVPGIERFGRMRLADLDRTGPRPLRTMWRIARDQLDERYGQLTIGEIIDRYSGTGGTSASA